jgi:hypothetical protein
VLLQDLNPLTNKRMGLIVPNERRDMVAEPKILGAKKLNKEWGYGSAMKKDLVTRAVLYVLSIALMSMFWQRPGAELRLRVKISFFLVPGIEDRRKLLLKLVRGDLTFHVCIA